MKRQIRKTELSDAAAVRDIYAPFITDSATSFETEVPDLAAMEERIRTITAQYPWLVFEEDGKVTGYAYATSHRVRKAYQWTVEVSVYLHESARRRGIGRALYLALFDLLRRQGYTNAVAGITLPNPASVRLHEAMGFTHIGVFSRCGFKFGKWHDVAWLELRLQEIESTVPEPIPVRDVFSATDSLTEFQKFLPPE